MKRRLCGPQLLRALREQEKFTPRLVRLRDALLIGLCLFILFLLFLLLPCRRAHGEDLGTYRVTAYCPCSKCCGKGAHGVSADGTVLIPKSRVVAAPRSTPMGTVLDIPGYGVARVADRGAAITEGRLDVFFWTHKEALNWGVRYLAVRRVKG
jgi:3D (Asp-Asp-Asp) domain-containing protein